MNIYDFIEISKPYQSWKDRTYYVVDDLDKISSKVYYDKLV